MPLTPTPRRSYRSHLGSAVAVIVALFLCGAVAQYGLSQAIPPGTPKGLADAGRVVVLSLAVFGAIAAGIACMGPRAR